MSATRYCYHCARHHPEEQMRLIDSKGGKRWRCIRSIEATKQDRAARDEFGRNVTAQNTAEARRRAQAMLNPEMSNRVNPR